MVEKIKAELDKLILVFIIKKYVLIDFSKIELFFNFETKNCLSTCVYIQ